MAKITPPRGLIVSPSGNPRSTPGQDIKRSFQDFHPFHYPPVRNLTQNRDVSRRDNWKTVARRAVLIVALVFARPLRIIIPRNFSSKLEQATLKESAPFPFQKRKNLRSKSFLTSFLSPQKFFQTDTKRETKIPPPPSRRFERIHSQQSNLVTGGGGLKP